MCQNYRLDLDKRQSKPAINLSAPQSSNIIPGKVNTNQQEPITVHLIVSFPSIIIHVSNCLLTRGYRYPVFIGPYDSRVYKD